MNIKFEFDTDSITQTECDALVAFLRGLTIRQSIDVLAVTQPQAVMAPTPAAHTASDRELEQLATDVADTQLPAAPAPAPTDLASIFGGAPAGNKPVWPFADTPEQPAAPASSAVTLDKNGLPWDARIHASSKAINADGSWRAKKMVDAAVVATVEAELRATMGAPAPVQTVSVTDGSAIPANAVVSSEGCSGPRYVSAAPAPAPLPASPVVIPAQPTPVAPTPVVTADPNTDLTTFLKEATMLINAGRATTMDMIAAANSVGIPHPGALTQRPDLIATVRAAFMAKVTPVAAV